MAAKTAAPSRAAEALPKLSIALLEELDACAPGLAAFRKAFGASKKEMRITRARLHKAVEAGLDAGWLITVLRARDLISDAVYAAFNRYRTADNRIYDAWEKATGSEKRQLREQFRSVAAAGADACDELDEFESVPGLIADAEAFLDSLLAAVPKITRQLESLRRITEARYTPQNRALVDKLADELGLK